MFSVSTISTPHICLTYSLKNFLFSRKLSVNYIQPEIATGLKMILLKPSYLSGWDGTKNIFP